MKAKRNTTPAIKSVDPSDVAKHKIFSYTTSSAPSGGNRKRRVTVRGIPGSKFSLFAQNENNEVYSFAGGGFDRAPSSLNAVIPPSGVFTAVINTQRSQSVDVRLTSAAPEVATQVIEDITAAHKLNFTVETTGLTGLTLTGSTVSSQFIPVGSTGSFDFSCVVTAAREQVINLVRQPHFSLKLSNADKDNGFVLYDGVVFKNASGDIINGLAHSVNADGQEIGSDIKYNPLADGSETIFNVVFNSTVLVGEESVYENSEGHSVGFSSGLVINGTVNVTSMGKADSNVKLMLFNFIESLTR